MPVLPEVQSIVGVTRDLLAQALGLPAAEIGASKTFFELGLTSRIGVIWMGRVNEAFGIAMPAVRAYNYPTLEKLAGRIREEMAAQEEGGSAAGKAPAMFGARGGRKGGAAAMQASADGSPAGGQLRRREIPAGKLLITGGAGGASGAAADPAAAGRPGADRFGGKEAAIAIVGMSGRFPGARDKSAFWQAIAEGRDCVSRVSRRYWNIGSVFSPKPQAGRTYSDWLGELDGIDQFDPLFFSISPADASRMDPQQRLFLQAAWSCLEDAGLRPDLLAGSRCGVFVGHGAYGQSQNGSDLSAAGFLGASPSILAARIAYLLDLRGPCVTLDTACSASLVAIAQACDSLMLGDSDLALAGGVSVLVDPSVHIMASQAGMLSPDGRCYSFDQRANGFVPGEGVGVVALKRLDDALRDGDHIYGKVIGWGTNQDGKTNGITAPSQTSQRELQQRVFSRFGIDPRSIGLMEAHGSGTKLGDPIEVEALVDAFRPHTADAGFCALGSVKSNIGHLLAAAGIAGFFKAALALKHRALPPTIHFDALNEHISLDGTPFFINTETRPWLAEAGRARRAAVSAFGFSGTNAYAVLEEHRDGPRAALSAGAPDREIIPLSALDDARLREYARALADAARGSGDGAPRLADIAHTLQVGRLAMDARLAIVAASLDELSAGLEAFLAGTEHATVFRGRGAERFDAGEIAASVERWTGEGRIEEIAGCWARYGFDWRGHQGWRGGSARRIDLPTYPFEPRTCEMPAFSPEARRAAQAVSPLVQANVSTFGQIAFQSTFDGAEFYFADHVVAGRKTLPGVAYLDIACAAGCAAAGERVSALRNVVWLRPFQIDETPATLTVRLKRGGERARFEIFERAADGERLCAQGELEFGGADERPRFALAERLARATRLADAGDCYARFDAQGFGYGPAFRGIRALQRSGDDIIARIELPEGLSQGAAADTGLAGLYTLLDGFVLHPGLLDSAFQPCHRACEAHDPARTYIPYALGGITVFDGLPARFYSIATPKHVDDDSALFSIALVDDGGKLIARIDDLTLRPIKAGNQAATQASPFHLYGMDWVEDAGDAMRETADAARLVFAPSGQEEIARDGDIVVLPGRGFRALGERRYEIDPGSAADHARLWEAVAGPASPLHVVHAWALADAGAADGAERLKGPLARCLYSPMFVARHLARHPALKKSALLCVHRCEEGRAEPEHAAIGGMMRSLAAELPELRVRSIGWDAREMAAADIGQLVRRELGIAYRAGEAVELRYAGGRRLALRARRLAEGARDGPGALRKGGVYLISGGAGGLGLMLAEALVKRHGARVALAGRTALAQLDASARERIRRLGDAHALYVAADVGDEAGAAALADAARARFGQLNGVFHCAGAMANAAVADKTPEAIARVVEPKVLGAVQLDLATRRDALDLFVVYSSIASIMRFPGQTDYAYANRFLDGFAARRQAQARAGERRGRTLAISWSLWRDGGMMLDEAKVDFLLRAHGLVPLEADSGLGALEVCLAADDAHEHVVVVRGRAEDIEANWPECGAWKTEVPRAALQTERVDAVAGQVRAELAALLKLDEADIDPDRNLMRYGLDSINALALINSLNDRFGIAAQPTELLRHPTLGEFARHLETAHLAGRVDGDAAAGEEEEARGAARPDDVASRLRTELAALLKLDEADIDPDRNLMRYGLDSINALALINKLNDSLGISAQPTELLRHPTLGEFARHLQAEHLAAAGKDDEAAAAPQAIAEPRAGDAYPDPYLAPFATFPGGGEDGRPWPMTYGQRALWFLHQFNGGSPAYHIALAFRLRSPLDMAAFERGYAALLRRHPSLRARFRDGAGEAEQFIDAATAPDLQRVDCAGDSVEAVLAAMRDAHRRPFDTERDPLSRVRVFVRGDADAFVLWTVHHLVSDAWSQWVLLDELLSGYAAERRGEAAAFAPLARTFADYARDEADFLASDEGRRQEAYWLRRLGGEIPRLNLPADSPRPRAQTFNGASLPVVCDADLSGALRQFAAGQGVTPFVALLAAYQCLLSRCSGDRRVWVGAPVSGRVERQYAEVVGSFINSVVLTADLGANPSFGDFARLQQRVVIEALEHQRVPFARLVQSLNPAREEGRAPLFQAEFVYQKAHKESGLIRVLSPEAGVVIEHQGLRIESVPFPQQEGQTDICLEMAEIDGRFVGSLKFNADLFSPETMRRLRDGFATLLARAIAVPDTPVLALPVTEQAADGAARLEGARGPSAGATVTEMFERQARQTPDAEALSDGRERWTYRELDARANRIAGHLRARGLKPGGRVALCMRRSADMVAALFAVMKAGGAYVPMDPAFPVERLRQMMEDASPALIVADRAATLPDGLALGGAALVDLDAQAGEIARREPVFGGETARLDGIAYVIYTSGSTGRPKGVQIPHSALANFLLSMRDKPGMSANDRLLAVTTISFDIAGLELYLPLVSGAAVALASREEAMDAFALQRLLAERRITVMQATPTTWQMLAEAGWRGGAGFSVLCGGEPLPRVLAQRLLLGGARVWNLYGPTETTIWSCIAEVSSDGGHAVEPIGEPIRNTSIHIVDDEMRGVPVGAIGELCIGGDGVAAGYLNRPELNAEKFVQMSGGRVYRTGDLARLSPDGRLEFHGRADNQLKIRGFRVEAGEIEHQIRSDERVADCVVTAWSRETADGVDCALAAYLVMSGGAPLTDAIRTQLRERAGRALPAYMVPSVFVALPAFPLTPNNKIDRKALPSPDAAQAAEPHAAAREAPRAQMDEGIVAAVWREVLRLDAAAADSHFFNAGGTSFTASRLMYALRRETGLTVPVSLLFEHPTLGAFSRRVRSLADQERAAAGAEPGASGHEAAEAADALLEILERVSQGRLSVDHATRLIDEIQ
ncbi:non-ribosomal peptide synthetase [Chromobacterium phragmitis]|uniref:non-ribosomal peptide synthetase n=1 Tax=Chromobacterium phragmitis TaxID=2202141 RepID=UPI00143CE729|nr:non-ribosomal peptide synthetase [Chromobacterium phragmitis]